MIFNLTDISVMNVRFINWNRLDVHETRDVTSAKIITTILLLGVPVFPPRIWSKRCSVVVNVQLNMHSP